MASDSILKRLDALIAAAKARHRGLPLYRLTPADRLTYNAWQAGQSADYAAYLDSGALPDDNPLPPGILSALGLDREPPVIPEGATVADAFEIYTKYLEGY